MAKKSRPSPGKGRTAPPARPKHENVIQRAAEEIEARFLEGAEQATDTTSSETNVILAAIGAIEGPREAKPKVKGSHDKRKPVRSKKR
ncbi:MAG TPA: hypothetical protein VFR68_08290 [Candidatus Dormibacteraeota bacterium]|nr:hypothetical protein [Candidatus Dormibacteraeota bacterium]